MPRPEPSFVKDQNGGGLESVLTLMLNLAKGIAAFALFGALFVAFIMGVALAVYLLYTDKWYLALVVLGALGVWWHFTMQVHKTGSRKDWGI